MDELKQGETEDIYRVIKKFEHLFNRVDHWLLRFKDHKNEKSFELLGGIFCEGFFIAKLREIFQTKKEM